MSALMEPPVWPMADHAPERLTTFLYLLHRDLLPGRYVDALMAHLESDRHRHLARDPDMWSYCEKIARRLCYEQAEVRESG